MATSEGGTTKQGSPKTPRVVPLTPSNAIAVCDVLKSSGFSTADWESLAPRLGVMDTKSIWTAHQRDPFLCLKDVISQWLHSDPQASWVRLANEVSKVEGYGANTAQTMLGMAESGVSEHTTALSPITHHYQHPPPPTPASYNIPTGTHPPPPTPASYNIPTGTHPPPHTPALYNIPTGAHPPPPTPASYNIPTGMHPPPPILASYNIPTGTHPPPPTPASYNIPTGTHPPSPTPASYNIPTGTHPPPPTPASYNIPTGTHPPPPTPASYNVPTGTHPPPPTPASYNIPTGTHPPPPTPASYNIPTGMHPPPPTPASYNIPTGTHPPPPTPASYNIPTGTHPPPPTPASYNVPTGTHPPPPTSASYNIPTGTHPPSPTPASYNIPTGTHPPPPTPASYNIPTGTHPPPPTPASYNVPTGTHPPPPTPASYNIPTGTHPPPPTPASYNIPTGMHPPPPTPASYNIPTGTHPPPPTPASYNIPTGTHPPPPTPASYNVPTGTHPPPPTSASYNIPTGTHPPPPTPASYNIPTGMHPPPPTPASYNIPTGTHPPPPTPALYPYVNIPPAPFFPPTTHQYQHLLPLLHPPIPSIVLPHPTPQTPECIVEYGKVLKDQYQDMSILPSGDWPPSLGSQFAKLTIIKRQERLPDTDQAESLGMDYAHGRVATIAATETVIDNVTDCFDRSGSKVKVLLDGAPGIGKTTLSRKACKDWADGTKLQNYLLVVYLPLREKELREAKSIEDLLNVGNPKLQEKVAQQVCETFGEKLLLILDGFDELSSEDAIRPLILKIIEGKQLQKCSVLVTSRPYASYDLQELDCIAHHIEVVGFTQLQIQECIKQNIQDEGKATELVRLLQEKSDIISLCYTPLNTAIMLYVYKQEKCMPNTLTRLFEMFILNALKRHAKQTDPKLHKRIRSLSTLPRPLNNQLDALSTMAYQRLLAGKLVFQEEELESAFPDCPDSDLESNLLGLMTAVKSYSGTREETNYQFIHLNLQEFLAARHAAANLSPEEQTTLIQRHLKDNHLRMMLVFLAGTSQLKGIDVKAIFSRKPINLQHYRHHSKNVERAPHSEHNELATYGDDRSVISAPHSEHNELATYGDDISVISAPHSEHYELATHSDDRSVISAPRCKLKTRIGALRRKQKSIYAIGKMVNRFLSFLHLIHESQNSGIYQTLLNTMANKRKLHFSFHRLTPSDCTVLSHFLSATGHSWELLHFHFCGLTAHSIEAFRRACSHHTDTTIKEVRISYNSSSVLTRLSLLPKISWLKRSKRLIFQGIQCPQGIPADQIQLHSLLDLESLSDLELQVERIPESHISDYGVVLNRFMAEVVHKRKLQRLIYTGPYPPHCEANIARLFEHRMSAEVPLQHLELTLLRLGKVSVDTSLPSHHYFKLELGDKPEAEAEECQQFFKALNECHTEHQKLLVRGLTNTTTDQFAAGLVENKSVKIILLDISNNKISSAGGEAIFRSLEHNTSLEELNMSWNRQLTKGDSEAVGCAVERMLTVNTNLKVLKLRGCGVTDIVVKYMAVGLAENKSVKILEISHNNISSAGGEAIFRSLEHNTSLEELNMSGNAVGDSEAVGCAVERMLTVNTTLKVLKLSKYGVTDTVVKYIVAGLAENKSVKILDISGYNISSAGGEVIFRSLEHNTSLEELNMSGNTVGDSEAVGCAVERMLTVNTTLKVLKLRWCGFTDTVVKYMAAGLADNKSVKTLDTSNSAIFWIRDSENKISSAGGEAIFRSLEHNTSLEELNMSWNRQLTKGDSEAVGCAVERMLTVNTNLKVLKLRGCGVTDIVVKYMAVGLAENKSVKILEISHNNISSAGGEAIFRSLEHNTSLEELDMSWNRQLTEGDSEAVGCAIERMLTVNTTLKVLELEGCEVTDTVVKYMVVGLAENKSVKILEISHNNISSAGGEAIFRSLEHNTSLEELDMSHTVDDSEAVGCAVERLLTANTTLKVLNMADYHGLDRTAMKRIATQWPGTLHY